VRCGVSGGCVAGKLIATWLRNNVVAVDCASPSHAYIAAKGQGNGKG